MRLLVVSAVGAWHRLGAVSQPTKICSACRISAALFCLRPTHTLTKQQRARATYTPPAANQRWFSSGKRKIHEGNLRILNLDSSNHWKGFLGTQSELTFTGFFVQRHKHTSPLEDIHLKHSSPTEVLLLGGSGGVTLFVASLLFVLFVY